MVGSIPSLDVDMMEELASLALIPNDKISRGSLETTKSRTVLQVSPSIRPSIKGLRTM